MDALKALPVWESCTTRRSRRIAPSAMSCCSRQTNRNARDAFAGQPYPPEEEKLMKEIGLL